MTPAATGNLGGDRHFQELLSILGEVADIQGAAAVLVWDEQTYMPPGGARARAQQKETLERLAHERLSSPRVGELLDRLEEKLAGEPSGSWEAALVRAARRLYDKAVKLPADLVAALSQAGSEGLMAWLEARRANDFGIFRPKLERLVELQVQKADALGWDENRYDALLDLYEPEMKTADISRIFTQLRERLLPMVRQISEQVDAVDASFLHQHYPADVQWNFTVELLTGIGFDFQRGRQDKSEHPFTISFSPDDARITTRIWENYLPASIFATIHEAGHAFYEMGLPREWERTPAGAAVSLGVHESQSRLWENVVGRSRAFWEHFFPRLKDFFPTQLEKVSLDQFYRAINRVEPSLIRVEADEVTYNLHIFLRFELEQQLLDGSLAVADLPEAWNKKMEEYLGLVPPDDLQGVLQDVHWSGDSFGYFPTYTLGTILSVQLFRQAQTVHPDLVEQIRSGDFDTLHAWLQQNVYSHGSRYTPKELVRHVTGGDLDAGPYLDYLHGKYSEIYEL